MTAVEVEDGKGLMVGRASWFARQVAKRHLLIQN